MKKTIFLASLAVLLTGYSLEQTSAQTRANVPPKTDSSKTTITTTDVTITPDKMAKKMGNKKSGKKDAVAAVTPVLLTPTETTGGVSDQLVDDVIRGVQRRMEMNGQYSGVYMRRSLATIKRGLADQTLTSSDVEKPFTSSAKLAKLSAVSGYQAILTSTIADYKYDEEKKVVSFDMTLRLVDNSSGKPVIRIANDTITGKPGIKGQTEVQVALDTVRDGTEKLSAQLFPATDPGTGTKMSVTKPGKKSKK